MPPMKRAGASDSFVSGLHLPKRRRAAVSWLLLLAALASPLGGCQWLRPGGPLTLRSLDQSPVELPLRLPRGVYVVHPSETSILLADQPLETFLQGAPREGQLLHAQVLWVPKPGTTPAAPTATNVTLRWVVFSGGEVGVYGGAGFGWPSGRVGEGSISLTIDGSTLTLLAATPGFVDLVSPAAITGTIRASYRPEEALRLRQAVSQIVTDSVGRAYWVETSPGPRSLPRGPSGPAWAAAPTAWPAAARSASAGP